MPKKLIDIYPPKKFTDSSLEESLAPVGSTSPGASFSFTTKKLLLGLPLVLVPFLVIHFFFAEAKIMLWPQVTELHITEQIVSEINQENVALEKKLIPAKLFEQEKEATESFVATGTDEREEKASGTIRVFNDNASAQTLVQNTRFISEDGKLFRSTERTTVPAGTNNNPGSIDVQVVAAEPGKDYNISSSNFSLPGLAGSALYTKVYGKSSASMTGGAVGQVSVVTTEDIQSAKEQLLESLEVDAKSALVSRIPPNFVILENSMKTELLQDNSLVQEGAALEEFTYTASLKVSTLAFAKEDANILARHAFESYLKDMQKIKEGTFAVNYTVEAANIDTGRMVLSADISAQEYTVIDLQSVENKIRGASRADITNIVSGFSSLEKVEFSLWPFWLQSVPSDSSKIEIELSL